MGVHARHASLPSRGHRTSAAQWWIELDLVRPEAPAASLASTMSDRLSRKDTALR
jgi:hypothetical protein